MTTVPEALQLAASHHRAGRLSEAADIYRQILARDPGHAEAMHSLGLVAHQSGQHDAAIRLMSAAIRIDGSQGAYYSNLGLAYKATGQLDTAGTCLLEAIQRQPSVPGYYYNLALIHAAQGEQSAAADRCRQALALAADSAEAHNLLGTALRALGQGSEARACFERAVACKPGYCDALVNLAGTLVETRQFEQARECLNRALRARPDAADLHTRLGDVHSAQGEWPAAVAQYQRALQLDPNNAVAHRHWGMALQAQEQFDAAVEHYQRALEFAPDDIETLLHLAATLAFQGKETEAVEHYARILAIEPTNPRVLTNVSAILQRRGRFDEALAFHDRALLKSPDDAYTHLSRAIVLLTKGDLRAGFEEYRWRTKVFISPADVIQGPMWDGSHAPTATVLLHGEQGLGDAIQFVRYLPLVRQRVARPILMLNDGLAPLLRESGFADVLGFSDPLPQYDYRIPQLDLPYVFGTTLETIPNQVPYLSANPQLVDAWRERLAGVSGFRVGICWQGSPKLLRDHARSVPLVEFAPLASVPGVRLVSLQKGLGVEQLAALSGQFEVHDLQPEYDGETGAFMNAAAVMRNLDLVVAVDTAIAHLAGALAVPVWVALPTWADWRWLWGREDSPWYPTMRLFRQQNPGQWAAVFDRIAAELQTLVAGRRVPPEAPSIH